MGKCFVVEPLVDREKYITFVANYLRKSRGESEADLDKHRIILKEMCEKNGWKYVEYFEIESGDSIDARPEFKRLLQDIEEGIFDAIAVVEIDRLGRGSKGDQDLIENTFRKTNTLIATPTKIYDLSNEDDEFVVDMKGFLARREYKMILKRLNQGKKVGAKRGDWTNGTPPHPYEYERWKDKYNPKGLVVNDDKLKIYRFMIDCIVRYKMKPAEIAWQLNKDNIPGPRGGVWHGNTVARLLVDETHLGKIISNKSKGDGHKKKRPNSHPVTYLPKNEWVIVENCHQAVKTLEEQDMIRTILHSRNIAPTRVRRGKRPLSGLIKCANCGHTMQIVYREDRKSSESIKPCWYKDPYGNKCGNGGGIITPVYEAVIKELKVYEEKIKHEIESNEEDKTEAIQHDIRMKLKEVQMKERALDRIHEAYEEGIYSLDEFKSRKEKVNKEIAKLREELEILEIQLKHAERMTDEDRLSAIMDFWESFNNEDLDPEELNRLYKSIIDEIVWKREGDVITVTVNFL